MLEKKPPGQGKALEAYLRVALGCSALLLFLAACTGPSPQTLGGDGFPSVSGPLALSPDERTLWVVNPDADSVTAVDVATLQPRAPLPVGDEPWGVAVAPDGTVLVMNRVSGSVSVLQNGSRSDVFVGPEPGGLALSPSGKLAYLTVSSQDELAVLDVGKSEVVRRIRVDRVPWAIAVTDDGDADDCDETIVLTHRFARLRPGGAEVENDGKEGVLTILEAGALSPRASPLSPYDFGYANGLEGLTIHDGTAFVGHLLDSPELPRDFETTVSGALTPVLLATGGEISSQKLHLNDSGFSTPTNFPRALAASPDGNTLYVVLAGTDAVMGVDRSNPEAARLVGFWPSGKNPRGIVLDRAGARAYVMNFLSRDVSVLDLSDHKARRELARVPVVGETLELTVLQGKILFNKASDPRLSHLGWISCATCHFDGGVDGTTWLTPDGPRQTQPLWNLGGTAPFHASATRDEIQDFEHDIEGLMAGFGLAPEKAQPELGTPNGSRSTDLEALAEYVLKATRVPDAPELDADTVARGRQVFIGANCQSCHTGRKWTNSALPGEVGTLDTDGDKMVDSVLRDVGTLNPSDVLGQQGFDVQTLLGVHATPPYLHDGSAQRLEDVLANPKHAGKTLSPAEIGDLATFLRSIDASSPPIP